MQWLILVAYRLKSGHLSGDLPDWTISERYDIDAKTGDASGEDQVLLALQALLRDRFQLKEHVETRQEPVYFLTIGKNGIKMPPGSCVPKKQDLPNECYSSTSEGLVQTMDWRGVRMSDPTGVAYRSLSGHLNVNDRPVIDKTGLTGTFDVHLRWARDPNTPDAPADPAPHRSSTPWNNSGSSWNRAVVRWNMWLLTMWKGRAEIKMFERYTEQARRAVFFARYEASRFGSPYLEAEHLLLGIMRETGALAGFPGGVLDEVRSEIEKMSPERIEISTSMDLPVSGTVKRTLSRAAEEADASNDKHIGPEHLLLALLTEGGSNVTGILQKFGIDRESVSRSRLTQASAPPPDRESLRSLIDHLPEQAVKPAKQMLERFQTFPPVPPPRIAELQKEMHDKARAALKPGTGMIGGGTWVRDAQGGIREGTYSSSRFEDGSEVVETHRFRAGVEITLIERLRLSDDGKRLSYSQEISGPGQSFEHTIDFEVPAKEP